MTLRSRHPEQNGAIPNVAFEVACFFADSRQFREDASDRGAGAREQRFTQIPAGFVDSARWRVLRSG
jgi:hypothetical protein